MDDQASTTRDRRLWTEHLCTRRERTLRLHVADFICLKATVDYCLLHELDV